MNHCLKLFVLKHSNNAIAFLNYTKKLFIYLYYVKDRHLLVIASEILFPDHLQIGKDREILQISRDRHNFCMFLCSLTRLISDYR